MELQPAAFEGNVRAKCKKNLNNCSYVDRNYPFAYVKDSQRQEIQNSLNLLEMAIRISDVIYVSRVSGMNKKSFVKWSKNSNFACAVDSARKVRYSKEVLILYAEGYPYLLQSHFISCLLKEFLPLKSDWIPLFEREPSVWLGELRCFMFPFLCTRGKHDDTMLTFSLLTLLSFNLQNWFLWHIIVLST